MELAVTIPISQIQTSVSVLDLFHDDRVPCILRALYEAKPSSETAGRGNHSDNCSVLQIKVCFG